MFSLHLLLVFSSLFVIIYNKCSIAFIWNMQDLGYYFLTFDSNLAYACCYSIKKIRKYHTLIKVQQLNENSPNHKKRKKKIKENLNLLLASSFFAHNWNFECTSTAAAFPKNSFHCILLGPCL